MIEICIAAAIVGWAGFFWLLYCRLLDVKQSRATANIQPSIAQIFEVLSDEERRLMAYHEAGHAVVSMNMPQREPLIKVTIIPSELGFGVTQTQPRMKFNGTIVSMSSSVAVFLAGRLAEELFCNEITTSAYNDFIQANQIAREMVVCFGMGTKTRFFIPDDRASEAFRRQADEDVMEILNNAQATALKILKERADDVHRIAKELLEKGTIEIAAKNAKNA
ncbi:MAG: hypothetical protein IKX40_06090 [Thermoguttaceae bacterium]|nr:hypothetical protein [Thermoguttaceae bacterium]